MTCNNNNGRFSKGQKKLCDIYIDCDVTEMMLSAQWSSLILIGNMEFAHEA